ncbi:hypothetical protein TNCV_2134781 [Trichonephila clavipes]|nr:hypothetical protein TNCV_2134781 [Trichonephila clavipes]
MERRAGSQWPPITNIREDRYVTHIALIDCAAKLRVKNWGRLQDNCLHEQLDDICSSGDHGSDYPCCCITDRNLFNGVINDEPGHMNGETYFQMNPGSVYSIKMAVPMFGGILRDGMGCYWIHLLFALMAL